MIKNNLGVFLYLDYATLSLPICYILVVYHDYDLIYAIHYYYLYYVTCTCFRVT